jgi:hypothetical protein
MTDNESYQNLDYPARTRRASNRIGLQEIDEDGALWLSHGKVYSCRCSVFRRKGGCGINE